MTAAGALSARGRDPQPPTRAAALSSASQAAMPAALAHGGCAVAVIAYGDETHCPAPRPARTISPGSEIVVSH